MAAGIAYGQSNDAGLPPVNLPSFEDGQQPRQPLQIYINKPPSQTNANGTAADEFPAYGSERTQQEGASAADQFPEFKPQPYDAKQQIAQPSGSFAERAADYGSSLGSGVVKGTAAIAGLPGDLYSLVGQGMDFAADKLGLPQASVPPGYRPDTFNLQPQTSQVEQAIKPYVPEAISPDYQPKDTIGHTLQTAGEFVPSAILGPGGVAKKAAYQVALPAITTTAGGKALEGTKAEGAGKAAGGFVGAVVGGVLSGRGGATKGLRSQLPANLTKAEVAEARQLMQQARSQGVALSWPEALSQVKGSPVLQDAQRIAESSPHSRATMQEFMGDRPAQVRGAFEQQADTLAAPTSTPSAIGPAAAQTAEETVGDVRKAINKRAEPYYKSSEGVLLTPAEMAKVKALPGYEEAAATVRGDPQLNRYVSHLPDNSVGFLNEVKKVLDQQAENAASKFSQNRSQQRSAGMSSDAASVKQAGVTKSSDYGTALSIEADLRQRYLEPLMKGPLGRVAQSKDTKNAIDALFPSNPLPNSEREISLAVSALAKRRPAVAEQLVRAYAEMVFNEADRALQGGANQFAGAKFAVRIAGNQQQRANLKAAIEALPNGGAKWAGFEKFLDVVEATGRRQAIGSKTEFNRLELAMMSGSGAVGEAVKLGASPGKWLSAVSEKWSHWQLGRNLDDVARIITDPASDKFFSKLASMPTQSAEANAIAARITLQVLEGGRGPASK